MQVVSKWSVFLIVAAVLGGIITACSTSEPGSSPAAVLTEPTTTPTARTTATPTTLATTAPRATPVVILQPYPYTTPLPPPTPTILDGVYQRVVPDRGTPVPCRRCAPYKAEGGTWTLKLKTGVFRVSHEITQFQGVGSFTVTGDRIIFFNDPNCFREVGIYRWHLDGRSLVLEEVDDPCAFGLRSDNLTAGRWLAAEQQGRSIDLCQPPNIEAAVTGHWPAPPGCQPNTVAQSK